MSDRCWIFRLVDVIVAAGFVLGVIAATAVGVGS